MANLATYQNAANSIYDPQLQADLMQNDQKAKDTQANLDQESKTIEPAYQTALRGLNDQVTANEGKLNQLYSQRLGGNFSGLEGNDMGMMYSKANQNRTGIETARADKLSSIALRRTQASEGATTTAASLKSKYGGMKNQYAQTGYQNAVRQEQNNAIAQQRINKSASKASAAAPATDPTAPFTTAFGDFMKSQGGKTPSRQAQDEYVNSLFDNNGIKSNAARQVVWNAVNAQFKRIADPTKDWTYQR